MPRFAAIWACPTNPLVTVAMAAALPHSAWQPPWAPAILARFAATMPKAPTVNIAMTASLSDIFPSSSRVRMQPGRIPQLPDDQGYPEII